MKGPIMGMTNQESHTEANRKAWSSPAYYDAWRKFYGTPEEIAREMRQNPWQQLRRYRRHFGDVSGKRVANLLGSIGRKAVPLALLGAEVTVVDISAVNARFAQELAEAAGVRIEYVVCDVLALDRSRFGNRFEYVFMEGGVLHYFVDLAPLAALSLRLLRPGGRLILGEAHPIRKCVKTDNGIARLDGDYFDAAVHEHPLPLAGYLPETERKTCAATRCRYWTMGEIVTGFAEAGFVIRALEETPGDITTIPGMFHLIADKTESK
jgi:SAM-dependent methyltransferase